MNQIKLKLELKYLLIIHLLLSLNTINLYSASHNLYQYFSFTNILYAGIFSGTEIAPPHYNESFLLKKNVSKNDTIVKNNYIEKIYGSNDNYNVVIHTESPDVKIRISVLNMLAKEIKVIHDGTHKQGSIPYNFDVSNLPNGVYFCVLQGKNFRDVKKFVISR